MAKLITRCPSCGESHIKITQMDCQSCGVKFEGNFALPEMLKLSEDDLSFIQTFVKCSGSLKEMSKIFEVSYPTMRNRLNTIIEQLNELSNKEVLQRDKIISALEKGEINAREAADLLAKL